MGELRDNLRVDCAEKCIVSLTGLHYTALVKNISPGGALVQFFHRPPDLCIGDSCQVSLYGIFEGQHYSKVTRVEPYKIAFKFMN